MRALRLTVNVLVILLMPVWVLPAMIYEIATHRRKYGFSSELLGKKWFWES